MRSKFTFILLALNLAVFGYLLFSERPWSSTLRIEENRRRVLGPEAANLTNLEISVSSGTGVPTVDGEASRLAASSPTSTQSVRLERRGEAWFLASPLDWPANDFAVRRILNELQFLEHETSFPVSDLGRNGQTLADYGLDSPRIVVTCTPAATATDAAAPAPFVLKIGATPAVGNRLYVLSPDASRVHVVGQSLAVALSLDLAQLRSDQLFTIPVFEARALTLQAGSTNTARTRLRRDQTRWLFEAPITTRAAKTPVELLVNDLNSLRVSRFLPADGDIAPEVTGLATPHVRITLEGNARRESLSLGLPVSPPAEGAETVELYARLDWRTTPSSNEQPVLFTVSVPVPVLDTLDKAQTALRDPRVLDFDPSRVTAIGLAAPLLPELRIQKLDSTAAWQIAAAPAVPLRADPILVERLLQRLQLLEAVRFASDAPSRLELENLGFNRPERTVTLQFSPDSPTANAPATAPSSLTLELAQPGGADPGLYVRVAGQPFVYAVAPDTLDQIPLAPRVYRDRSLAQLPEATKITRLVIRATNAAPDASPLLDYVADDQTPPTPVATLLAAIRSLRAKNIVREDYPATVLVDGAEQPWAYSLEATLDPAPADGPLTLSLAERTGGMTQLVGSPALGLVFTVEQPVLDALWAILYGPRDIPAP